MSEQQPLSLVDAHNADGMCWCITCGTDRLQAGVAADLAQRKEAKRLAASAKRIRDAKAMPLRSANGTIYAYACGLCHHVAGGAEKLCRPDDDKPFASLVEGSLHRAMSCCTCRECGDETFDRRSRCTDCGIWDDFARTWHLISYCARNGLKSVREWQQHVRDEDEDNE